MFLEFLNAGELPKSHQTCRNRANFEFIPTGAVLIWFCDLRGNLSRLRASGGIIVFLMSGLRHEKKPPRITMRALPLFVYGTALAMLIITSYGHGFYFSIVRFRADSCRTSTPPPYPIASSGSFFPLTAAWCGFVCIKQVNRFCRLQTMQGSIPAPLS